MQTRVFSLRRSIAAATAATLMTLGPVAAGYAQTGNVIQRHPDASGIAAAVATHHALKVTARNRKRSGRKLNFAERHPTMSGLGAGLLTRHEIKAHTAH